MQKQAREREFFTWLNYMLIYQAARMYVFIYSAAKHAKKR